MRVTNSIAASTGSPAFREDGGMGGAVAIEQGCWRGVA